MLKNIEHLSPTKKRLAIHIPQEAVAQEINQQYASIRQEARFPGFRKGHAPMTLVKKQYANAVKADALDRLVPRYFMQAMDEAKLKPLASPMLESGLEGFSPDAALDIIFTIEVMPDTPDLKYTGVKIKDIPIKIEDNDIDDTLAKFQRDRAKHVPIDAAIAHGHVVEFEYTIKGEEGEPRQDALEIGNPGVLEAFNQNLTGKKKGDSVEFTVEFPATFSTKELAGKSKDFSVTVKEVKEVVPPALDDEFAKDMDFDSLAELRAQIKTRLEESQQKYIDNILKGALVNQILEAHPLDVPESMLEAEITSLLTKARGAGDQKPEAEIRAEMEAVARRNVQASLLLRIVAEREDLSVEDKEVEARVMEFASRMHMPPESVIRYFVARDGSLDGLRNNVLEDKVLALLLEKAEREPAEAAQ